MAITFVVKLVFIFINYSHSHTGTFELPWTSYLVIGLIGCADSKL